MIALADNLYIFAPRITARLAAVLLAVRNIAAACNVREFLVLLVYHDNSSIDTVLDSQFLTAARARITDDLLRRFYARTHDRVPGCY